jgi:hypothetical protein
MIILAYSFVYNSGMRNPNIMRKLKTKSSW